MQKSAKGLTLLPEDLLIMACKHEHFEMNRYRLLSLRFLAFNTGISRLLEVLANESEQRVQSLNEASRKFCMMDKLPDYMPPHRLGVEKDFLQFFVINNGVAADILMCSSAYEQRSLQFYCQLRERNVTPELDEIIGLFIDQARIQCQILQEIQDQLLFNERALPMSRVA